MFTDKNSLRKHLKQRRAALSSEERINAAVRILDYIRSAEWWKRAQAVHCYCATGTEVPTQALIEAAFREGKRVLVPITPEQGTTLHHAEIFPDTRFTTDKYGIPIPTPETSRRCEEPLLVLTPEDCVFVPLLGYDAALNRIGYGGGFYDRFLSTFLLQRSQRPVFVGLAYSVQFVEGGVNAEKHDIMLDCVVTDQSVIAPCYDMFVTTRPVAGEIRR